LARRGCDHQKQQQRRQDKQVVARLGQIGGAQTERDADQRQAEQDLAAGSMAVGGRYKQQQGAEQ